MNLEELFRNKARYELYVCHRDALIRFGSKHAYTKEEAIAHAKKVMEKRKSRGKEITGTISACKVMPSEYWHHFTKQEPMCTKEEFQKLEEWYEV